MHLWISHEEGVSLRAGWQMRSGLPRDGEVYQPPSVHRQRGAPTGVGILNTLVYGLNGRSPKTIPFFPGPSVLFVPQRTYGTLPIAMSERRPGAWLTR
jgi:hypothetical protein